MSVPSELVGALQNAQHLAVLTGAGVSAESGLPTFREAQTGLWAQYEPTELATPEAFLNNPRLVWEWYAWRRTLVDQAAPNPAHFALAAMARLVPQMTLITQNVDGLHQAAGSPSVLELHGNIRHTKCFDENVVVESWPQTNDVPPRCPRCGGLLRPDVVWFGESLPEEALDAAAAAALECDVFLSVGTSGQVEPAASLIRVAAQAGAVTAIFNLDPAPQAGQARFQVSGPAGQTLPALLQAASSS